MTALIASATAASDSADFTVVAGTPVTLFITTADGSAPGQDALAKVQIKSAASQYHTVGELSRQRTALVIDGPGTYRVSKGVSAVAHGVDKE